MGTVQIKRIYESVDNGDGKRILIDRLWPRGLKKESVQLDEWMKAIAPSAGLRKWFNHDPVKWHEFELKYAFELKQNKAVVERLLDIVEKNKTTTLLYAAHDEQHNHALVLQQFIIKTLK